VNPEPPLHVLVVDDSAVVRQMLTAILIREGAVTVSVAAHPLIAFEKMKQARPHVIVLDLEMPEMDGLSFLEQLMAKDPIPVVVCSGWAARGTEAALRAMEGGAVALIEKPQLGVKGFLHDSAVMLRDTVTAAARARVRPRTARRAPRMGKPVDAVRPQRKKDEASCVVFGMPKEAIALEAVDEVVGLDEMAQVMLGKVGEASAGHPREQRP